MYPEAYLEYLAHFHGTRDYFECHEVLEDYWKETDPENRESVWVCLIQLAVSQYHFRRNNTKGALTLIRKTLHKLTANHCQLQSLGIDYAALERQLVNQKKRLEDQRDYTSLTLPLSDPHLIEAVKLLCTDWGVSFGAPSDLSDSNLIDKHKRRRSS
ncbi:DUF309 domain-containing protein [Halobacillus naozhouensis]|uniref:DUF309 domain-containing protein n=1 Tax=Halobacillus naozhouensis TaxID=554880 RepID=A0ABY8IVF4_9BACI|nr:DUF309 domain-containing protein [Halobacillus naozhouensis]WFT73149.1 DUF309 domain-containing protein [Halobacillus naozhouensis]